MIKKTLLTSMLLVAIGVRAQNPTPYITIGDINVYESTDSIVGDCIQGVVSFDAETYTLILQEATITSPVWAVRGEDFKIKLLGDNAMESLLISPSYCTFIGPGSLSIGGSSVDNAITCPRTHQLLLTEGAALEITASVCGMDAFYDVLMDPDPHFPNLAVDSSTLIITAPTCLGMFGGIWLSGCRVVAPSDFQYQLDTWIPLTSGIHNYLEIRPGTVGVHAYETAEWRAWGVNGGVRIEGLQNNETIEVINMLGQSVSRNTPFETSTFIPLKRGYYLVRINNHTKKITVK